MAEVIIRLNDSLSERGVVKVNVEFDPPTVKGEAMTPAQIAASAALDGIHAKQSKRLLTRLPPLMIFSVASLAGVGLIVLLNWLVL